MLLMQLADHVPSYKAADTVSFSVSAGDNFAYTNGVHKLRDWKFQIQSFQ